MFPPQNDSEAWVGQRVFGRPDRASFHSFIFRIMKKLLILWFCIGALSGAKAASVELRSPDGSYRMTLSDEGGRLSYTLRWGDRTVVGPSQLGIEADGKWLDGLRLGETATASQDTLWHPVYGERSRIRDRYNACSVDILRGERGRIVLDMRAYDEGVAFRYRFSGGQYLHITDEYTEFTLPEGTKAYYTARAQTPYELLPLKNWPGESDRPLLCVLPDGGFVCLAEAGVVDYCRTKFRLSERPNTLSTAMYGPVDDIAPVATPWRVMMCSGEAGDILAHNDLLLNLNPPCRLTDASWIRPGKAMREVTLTTEGGKAVVDFAVRHKLQYVLFDSGWYGVEQDKASDATTVTIDPRRNQKPDALDLQAVIAYARERGIGVWLYVNQRALVQQLDEILPLYEQWGVAGIKFGFVQVGSHVWTRWMHEAVRKCADHHLMVDIHDEYRPTGVSRTYPNLLTQEGIRGNEEFPDATHNATLPFTRYVAGAADYTICYFRQDFGRFETQGDAYGVPRSRSILTTPAHQLALAAVYYSPLQLIYWYDKPSDAQDEPELKFFDDVYTTWDDTRILSGRVGEYISVARRHGEEWFVGSITGNEGRRLDVPLEFLPDGQSYLAEIYTDGDASLPTRTKVRIVRLRVERNDVLRFDLRPSGGAAIRLVPDSGSDRKVKRYRRQLL